MYFFSPVLMYFFISCSFVISLCVLCLDVCPSLFMYVCIASFLYLVFVFLDCIIYLFRYLFSGFFSYIVGSLCLSFYS